MTPTPLISIIVPIYNTEKYLRDCLDSIIKQTYHNLEIILVDDASVDHSADICREYQEKDSRILFLTKTQNEGVSKARNDGIEMASGTYLTFLDSDDLMAPDMVEKLFHAIQKNKADMAICSHTLFTSDGDICRHCVLPAAETMDKYGVYRLLCSGILDCYPWAKLYNRELFRKVRFPAGKKYEDVFVFPQVVECCTAITSIAEELVMYRVHPEAFTKSAYRIQHMDAVEAYLFIFHYAVEHKIDFLAACMRLHAYNRLIDAIKRCSFTAEEQSRIRQLRKQVVCDCGFHIKYTAMVYAYYWMRQLHIPIPFR